MTDHPQLFFLIGPLRTGSSLMSRCIDDHLQAICLCESEINRTLFPGHFLSLHLQRMKNHGLYADEVIALLDRKKQCDEKSLINWYYAASAMFSILYDKQNIQAFGDKSPDFYRSCELVKYFAPHYPLIYTVRDPRAILSSIMRQKDASDEDKEERWQNFINNFLAWENYLEFKNVLVVKFEDLILEPTKIITKVYHHIGLEYSPRFCEDFNRKFPQRFLWQTIVDYNNGMIKKFDSSKIRDWETHLTPQQLEKIYSSEEVSRFMNKFNY